jgi:dTDP-4-dehydrorhamnose 3,5-epimerase
VLSEANHSQIFIPAGFAHGFVVTAGDAIVAYKCTDYYEARSEQSIRWSDPDIAIAWPIATPRLSAKDASAPLLRQIPRERLPVYG